MVRFHFVSAMNRKYRASFCSQPFLNSSKPFDNQCLVPLRCYGQCLCDVLLNLFHYFIDFFNNRSNRTKSTFHIEISRTEALHELTQHRLTKFIGGLRGIISFLYKNKI